MAGSRASLLRIGPSKHSDTVTSVQRTTYLHIMKLRPATISVTSFSLLGTGASDEAVLRAYARHSFSPDGNL
jgi:hypothetical protein